MLSVTGRLIGAAIAGLQFLATAADTGPFLEIKFSNFKSGESTTSPVRFPNPQASRYSAWDWSASL